MCYALRASWTVRARSAVGSRRREARCIQTEVAVENQIPGQPTSRESTIGFGIYFLLAGLVALHAALRLEGVDAFTTTGPAVISEIGQEDLLGIFGKALLIAGVAGFLGAWGFTYPRLFVLGVLGSAFSIVGGPLLCDSIYKFYWTTIWRPVVVWLVVVSFALCFFMMMRTVTQFGD